MVDLGEVAVDVPGREPATESGNVYLFGTRPNASIA